MEPAGPTALGIRLWHRCREAADGLPFPVFMEAALYDPDEGYYASGRASIGRRGDFITSVSVGPCFGHLLAARIATWWQESGCPSQWRLIEQGAGDAKLLHDLLAALPPEPARAVDVMVVEPLPILRERQRAVLEETGRPVRWCASLAAAAGEGPAFFVANELLDAFPVERVRREGGIWKRLHVVASGAEGVGFDWRGVPVEDPVLAAELDALPPADWPEGCTTEICLPLVAWARDLAGAIGQGALLLADYGFEAAEHHHPSRMDGTLRAYRRHRAHDDPFAHVGESDLTSHVDWSSVRRHLGAAGFRCAPLVDQGRWLTRVAVPWLRSIEASGPPDAATRTRLRQFQTLTHPGGLGMAFQILEASLGG